jgi:NAD(P)-dependent dehydrogenase (short-subunit alcohol dehydrogenase family)
VPTLAKIRSGELPPLWPADSSLTGLMGPMMRQRSENIPLGRMGTPDDIALAVMYLASAAADYVTGQTLVVDGGWLLV